jgi:hypothetical protein
MQPIIIEGCLKSGTFADGTWVVLGRAAHIPSETAATYQLVDADTDSLRPHQDRVVRVSGTLEADRRVMTSTGLLPGDDDVEGTSGTPEVGITTTYDLRRLSVDEVTPTGEACE